MVETRRSRRKTRGAAEEEVEIRHDEVQPLSMASPTRRSARRVGKKRSMSHDLTLEGGTPRHHHGGGGSDTTGNESDVTPLKFGRRRRSLSDASYFHRTMEEEFKAIERQAKQTPSLEKIVEEEEGTKAALIQPRTMEEEFQAIEREAKQKKSGEKDNPPKKSSGKKLEDKHLTTPTTRSQKAERKSGNEEKDGDEIPGINDAPPDSGDLDTNETPSEIKKSKEETTEKALKSKPRQSSEETRRTRSKSPTRGRSPTRSRGRSPTRSKSPPRNRTPAPTNRKELSNHAVSMHKDPSMVTQEEIVNKKEKIPKAKPKGRSRSPTRSTSPNRSKSPKPEEKSAEHNEQEDKEEVKKEPTTREEKPQIRQSAVISTRSPTPTASKEEGVEPPKAPVQQLLENSTNEEIQGTASPNPARCKSPTPARPSTSLETPPEQSKLPQVKGQDDSTADTKQSSQPVADSKAAKDNVAHSGEAKAKQRERSKSPHPLSNNPTASTQAPSVAVEDERIEEQGKAQSSKAKEAPTSKRMQQQQSQPKEKGKVEDKQTSTKTKKAKNEKSKSPLHAQTTNASLNAEAQKEKSSKMKTTMEKGNKQVASKEETSTSKHPNPSTGEASVKEEEKKKRPVHGPSNDAAGKPQSSIQNEASTSSKRMQQQSQPKEHFKVQDKQASTKKKRAKRERSKSPIRTQSTNDSLNEEAQEKLPKIEAKVEAKEKREEKVISKQEKPSTSNLPEELTIKAGDQNDKRKRHVDDPSNDAPVPNKVEQTESGSMSRQQKSSSNREPKEDFTKPTKKQKTFSDATSDCGGKGSSSTLNSDDKKESDNVTAESDSVNKEGKLEQKSKASPAEEGEATSPRKRKVTDEPTHTETDEAEGERRSKPKSTKLVAKPRSSKSGTLKQNARTRKKKNKTPKNELTSLIPGYTAKLQLDSSSLKSEKLGLEAMRKRALVTDKTTAAFVKGSLANQKRAKEILAPSTSCGSAAKKASSSFKVKTKPVPPDHAGEKWFGMIPTPLTEEVKRDLHVIRNRSYLDPKRFYKSSDKESKIVQVGTVLEGNAEFYSSRLTKKQRRSNLTEEMMADPQTADYAKRKFKSMQQEQNDKVQKQQHYYKKKKRGKRAHA